MENKNKRSNSIKKIADYTSLFCFWEICSLAVAFNNLSVIRSDLNWLTWWKFIIEISLIYLYLDGSWKCCIRYDGLHDECIGWTKTFGWMEIFSAWASQSTKQRESQQVPHACTWCCSVSIFKCTKYIQRWWVKIHDLDGTNYNDQLMNVEYESVEKESTSHTGRNNNSQCMASWFRCAFCNYSFFSLSFSSLLKSILHYLVHFVWLPLLWMNCRRNCRNGSCRSRIKCGNEREIICNIRV